MLPVEKMPDEVSKNLLGVLTDIDDTITTDGRLPSVAYGMLERLSSEGLMVIPVTGRPAGWCDMIARFWPVAGVVGENGAVAMRYDRTGNKMRRTSFLDDRQREESKKKLAALAEKILKEIPGAALASDQQYRESDLAIDYCEDVEDLGEDNVQRIVRLFQESGATAKVSSIHVNGWIGDWDKLAMTKRFLAEEYQIDMESKKERFVFCGDSPNDAPMFGYFPHACGVANVKGHEGMMDHLPTYVASAKGALGFVEIGEKIISGRNLRPQADI